MASIKLPQPTQDQMEYLERIRAAGEDYDGTEIIGGPKRMTIKVMIENQDDKLTIEVIEENYNKERHARERGSPFAIGPGAKRSFECYHLRDLIIREQNHH